MHFFWIVFSYFFLRFIKDGKRSNSTLAGVFLGLALGTKFTSIILIPISGLTLIASLFNITKTNKFNFLKNSTGIYFFAGISFFITYIDLIIHRGFEGIYDVLRSIKDRYISKEIGGKIHIAGDMVFETSPWWFYLYYIKKMYTYLQMILYSISPLCVFLERNIFSFYWIIFFLVIFSFQQTLPVKSMRYFSSVEVPLVFLSSILLYNLHQRVKAKKALAGIIIISMMIIMLGRLSYISKIQPTKYEALKRFLIKETNNFSNN